MSAGRTPGAVAVAKTSVVDVWVEQLDPRLGEDFGWRRLLKLQRLLLPERPLLRDINPPCVKGIDK